MPAEPDAKTEELAAIIRTIQERVRARHPSGQIAGLSVQLPDLMPVVHARDAAEAKVAAIGTGKKLTDTSLEEWNRALAVNLTGVFLMSRAAVRQMLTQDIRSEARGRIVNISSQHGMIACPEDIAYGTSKSGVVYMTRQIAADYAKTFRVLRSLPCDIFLGSHASFFDGLGKAERLRTGAKENPFVDPQRHWEQILGQSLKNYRIL